ncbi:MAG: transposase domain-containing protein [Novosphingobium sp.]
MNSGAASCWFSLSELAKFGLPGLPGCPRLLRDFAANSGWADADAGDGTPLARRRAKQGGGMEYHVSLLTSEAQERLLAKVEVAPIAPNGSAAREAELWAQYNRQSAKNKARAEQRMALLMEVEAQEKAGSGRTAASNVVARKHGVCPRSIGDWRALVAGVPKEGWLPRLATQHKGGGKQVEIDEGAWQFFKKDYSRVSNPALKASYNRTVEEYAAPRGIAVPSFKTFKRRYDKEVPVLAQIALREGKEAVRLTNPPQRRTVLGLHAMEVVNSDGHEFDVFVEWEDGKIGRPIGIGIQDVYSRKMLAWRIGKSENTALIRLTFADLFQQWGIPENALMDNGRAFTSKAMTGGAKTRYRGKIAEDEVTGVLTSLGVHTRWAKPFRGSSKPIERAWRDLCAEHIAKHWSIEGAYTGNKPDAKPENYRQRAIPIAQFRELVAQQVAFHNARQGRRTEAAAGRSLDETFLASYNASTISKATQDQLCYALYESRESKCHKDHGAVQLFRNAYHTPEMVALRGQKVIVRFDPENLHSSVFIYRRTGEYLCEAPILSKVGFLDQQGAVEQGRAEANVRKQARKYVEAQNLLTERRMAELAKACAEPDDEVPRPKPGAARMVRPMGPTVAQLKPRQQTIPETAEPTFMDDFTAGIARLRVVE